MPFLFEGVFEGEDIIVDAEIAGDMILSYSGPLAMVDVTDIQKFVQIAIALHLWYHSVILQTGEFDVQFDLGQAIIPHFGDVSRSALLRLHYKDLDVSDLRLFKSINLGCHIRGF